MKRYNNLYPQIYDFKNLHNAFLKARRCKRYSPEVLSFSASLDEHLICLQNKLIWKSYHPSTYKEFYIHDPKTRLIAAPAFRDRVMHHAVYNVIAPKFDKKFIYDSYACRPGKGTHKGADRLTDFLGRSIRDWGMVYCLKCDIRSYFLSVQHHTLKQTIRKTIKCRNTLWLLDTIIDSCPGDIGIPLGNLTSQLFANIYLDPLDHFIKELLQIKYYVRYMDDFIILHTDKKVLKQSREEIACFLFPRGLSLNDKTSIFPTSHGIDFLGYRIWPTHRLLRKSSIRRAKRKFKMLSRRYREGRATRQKIEQSMRSWLSHARHCDSYNVRKTVLKSLVLQTYLKNRTLTQ